MSRQDEIRTQIDLYEKNLQTIRTQIAIEGGPGHASLKSINTERDTETELKKLWIQLGDVEVSEGNIKNAIAAYGHALRFDPDDAVLNDKLQKQYDLVDDLFEATKAFHNSENWARAAEDWQKLILWGFDIFGLLTKTYDQASKGWLEMS